MCFGRQGHRTFLVRIEPTFSVNTSLYQIQRYIYHQTKLDAALELKCSEDVEISYSSVYWEETPLQRKQICTTLHNIGLFFPPPWLLRSVQRISTCPSPCLPLHGSTTLLSPGSFAAANEENRHAGVGCLCASADLFSSLPGSVICFGSVCWAGHGANYLLKGKSEPNEPHWTAEVTGFIKHSPCVTGRCSHNMLFLYWPANDIFAATS